MSSPAFAAIETHDDLLAWSRAYAREARREWLLDVRLDLVEWTVSTRARRRAAAVKRPALPDASVGEPYDWESHPDADGRPLPSTVSLTWDAARAYDREAWAAVVRHELLHVEQYQRFGTTGHGAAFERRAREVEAPVECEPFAEPTWRFRCQDCDAVVARRYRDCPFVREYDEYHSECCGAPLVRERSAANEDDANEYDASQDDAGEEDANEDQPTVDETTSSAATD